MRHPWLTGLLIGLLPVAAFADGPRHSRGSFGSRNSFSISVGVGSGYDRFGFSYSRFDRPYIAARYYRTEPAYCPPVYYAPPVVYSTPVVIVREQPYCAPAPVVVYPSSQTYYCSPSVTTYTTSTTTYYYSR